ncbi:hypothetical protein N7492_001812 [Penicillium capsulatum]|uniref:Phytocyanin domain-containing protein n=1 Tax=Penicillium capsulatum TaxID=69766 RepID=A0A9W9LZS3_9EURO|nr:hypothetical protein N7492_001812 [Penicillium capsulatum]KAJ6129138.1 hypothetical protein N7512_001918 [Penicillium capsulatum]
MAIAIEIHNGLFFDIEEDTAIHHVAVGKNESLLFVPDRLNANIGDRIVFDINGLNHTVTRSSLEDPCSSINQFDTGFGQLNPDGRYGLSVTLTVNTLEPQWFFCRQDNPNPHCHAGMVFGLNPGNQMEQFRRNAKQKDFTSLSSINPFHIGPEISPSQTKFASSTVKPSPISSSSEMATISSPTKSYSTTILTKTVTTICSSVNSPPVIVPLSNILPPKSGAKSLPTNSHSSVKRNTYRATNSSGKLSYGFIQGLRGLALSHLVFLFM